MQITVVVRRYGEADALQQCLDSLAQQTLRDNLEVILTEDPAIARRSAPDLLKQALSQAQGDIIAVTDSRCFFPPDWLEKLHRAHQGNFPVIGGAVEPGGPNTLRAWAAYFADYGPFMLPAARRETFLLSGNHVSYRASLIRDALPSMTAGYSKTFLQWDLERQGVRSLFDPDLVISRALPESFVHFLARYFHDAREFATIRSRSISPGTRLLHILTASALPPVLLYRRVRAVWPKRRERFKLSLSIPLLALFVTSWSAGELIGYLIRGPEPRKAAGS